MGYDSFKVFKELFPDLKQEKGSSLTVGFVVTPRSIPALQNFVFTADYFKIDVEDAIV